MKVIKSFTIPEYHHYTKEHMCKLINSALFSESVDADAVISMTEETRVKNGTEIVKYVTVYFSKDVIMCKKCMVEMVEIEKDPSDDTPVNMYKCPECGDIY